MHDVSLHYTGRGKGGKGDAAEAAPPDAVIQEIDAQELNRVFVSRCKPRHDAAILYVLRKAFCLKEASNWNRLSTKVIPDIR